MMKYLVVVFLQILKISSSYEMKQENKRALVNNFTKTKEIDEVYELFNVETVNLFNENIIKPETIIVVRQLLDKLFIFFHDEATFYFELQNVFGAKQFADFLSCRIVYYQLLKKQELCLKTGGLFVVNAESFANYEPAHIQYLKTVCNHCNGDKHMKTCLIIKNTDFYKTREAIFQSFYIEIFQLLIDEKTEILLSHLNKLLYAMNNLMFEDLYDIYYQVIS